MVLKIKEYTNGYELIVISDIFSPKKRVDYQFGVQIPT